MMHRYVKYRCLTLLTATCLVTSASAWEIQLNSEVATRAAVVRLEDIGRISGLAADAARPIEQIVLAPGPSAAYSRTLSTSQVRKILVGRGVDLEDCRFTGALRCVVLYHPRQRGSSYLRDRGPSPATTLSDSVTSDSSSAILDRETGIRPLHYRARGGVALRDSIEDKLAEQVGAQLLRLSEEPIPWDVAVTLDPLALRDLPEQWDAVTVEGVEAAEEGRHELVACFVSDVGDVRLPIAVDAERKVQVVVPARALKRGEVIRPEDVQLQYVGGAVDQRKVASRMEEVVGRFVQFPIEAGQPLPTRALKKPILVKRREEIEVVARRGGIVIKTPVRAIDDGALGDIISVERIDGSKERFVARVVGVQQAEVFVSSARVAPESGY